MPTSWHTWMENPPIMTPSKPDMTPPKNPPDSLCACGHLESKHAPLSPYGLTAPHAGVCNADPACPCRRFTWRSFAAKKPPDQQPPVAANEHAQPA